MENEIAENINIADISFIGDEDVRISAGKIGINHIDASRLTPQQIKDMETLGKKYPGHVIQAGSLERHFKDGDIKGNLINSWNINTLKGE